MRHNSIQEQKKNYIYSLLQRIQEETPYHTQSNINKQGVKYSLLDRQTIPNIYQSNPIVLADIQEVLNKSTIKANLNKQLENQENLALITIQLRKQNQIRQNYFQQLTSNTKIGLDVKFKDIFNNINSENNKLTQLKECNVKNYIYQKRQQVQNNIKYGSWSIRLFPTHRSLNKIFQSLPTQIIPLSKYDIFSYKKYINSIKIQYFFGYQNYHQIRRNTIQTQICMNFGQTNVKFVLFQANIQVDNQIQKQKYRNFHQIILRPMQIIVIPSGFYCKISSNCINNQNLSFQLLSWTIIPKKYLFRIINLIQSQPQITSNIDYSLIKILIDFVFHEHDIHQAIQFEIKKSENENEYYMKNNQTLIYQFANFLISQFKKQYDQLKSINVEDQEIVMKKVNKNIDICQNCNYNYIVNYFSQYKNKIYCINCIKQNVKITEVFQKISLKTFQNACRFLINYQGYKDILKSQNVCPQKVLKHACFFEYEDLCDGQFIGSYNSIHCKIIESNDRKHTILKDQLIKDTFFNVRKRLALQSAHNIFCTYSKKKFKNQQEKNIYKEILLRSSLLIKKEENQNVLRQVFPSYEDDNLKLLAIKLCAQGRF